MGGTGAGPLAVQAVLASSLTALAISVYGYRRGRRAAIRWGRRALVLSFGFLTLAVAVLALALLRGDWSLSYVTDYASRETPWPYRLAALWAGMAGSLLVWTWVLGLWTVAAILWCKRRLSQMSGAVQGVLAAAIALLSGLLIWATPPFERLAIPAIDGSGLTPVLRHPAMLYHPLLLYAGQVGLVVPFALAVAARMHGLPVGQWLPSARRWMTASLVLLGGAMVAGSHWAYVELGWGGYWAWDPVENAALLPWVAGLAFLHLAHPARHSLDEDGVAAARLSAVTFGLALGGAFLARSGATGSVHAFAEAATVGRVLGAALAVVAVGWVSVERRRRRAAPVAATARPASHPLSRERALLGAAVALLLLVAVVSVGTVLPVAWRAMTGDRLVVTGRYFAAVTWPFALALLALTGAGPRLRPGGTGWHNLVPRFRPILVAVPGAALAWWWLERPTPLAVASAGLAAAAAALTIAELRARRAGWRQAGGLLAHLGAAVLLVAVTASATGTHRDGVLGPDQELRIGGYTLRLEGITATDGDGPGAAVEAAIAVWRAGDRVSTLRPQAIVAPNGQRASVAGLRSTPLEDLSVMLRAVGPDGDEAVVAVSVTPLAAWVWWGGLLVLLGMGVALAAGHEQRRAAAPAAAPPSVEVEVGLAPLAAQQPVDGGGRGRGNGLAPPPVATQGARGTAGRRGS